MARPKRPDAPYFSARLRNKLHEAPDMRGIIIEAPSGYPRLSSLSEFPTHGASDCLNIDTVVAFLCGVFRVSRAIP